MGRKEYFDAVESLHENMTEQSRLEKKIERHAMIFGIVMIGVSTLSYLSGNLKYVFEAK